MNDVPDKQDDAWMYIPWSMIYEVCQAYGLTKEDIDNLTIQEFMSLRLDLHRVRRLHDDSRS